MRSMYYAANKEADFKKWYADNLFCEVHVYPSINKYAILNNTNEYQKTKVYDGEGNSVELTLEPGEISWKEISHE